MFSRRLLDSSLFSRFDQVGIYVVMFLEILQTLIKVLIVFSILIIAFGLAFYILLSRVSSQYQLLSLRNNYADIHRREKEAYFFSFSGEM
jgi:hypothetical protein